MMVRLMYASRSTAQAGDKEDLAALLKQSKANNPSLGITGVLCFSAGTFLQVIEGARPAVSRLYHRIVADARHQDVVLLSHEEIHERRFGCWAMGQVDLSRVNPGLLMKYSETAELNPFAMSAKSSMALFDDLVATASVVGQSG